MTHKLRYLRDSFRSLELDTSIWDASGPGMAYFNGSVQFDPSQTDTVLESVHDFSLVNSEVEAHVGLLGTGQTREFGMEVRIDADNGLSIWNNDTQLVFRVRVAGVDNDTSVDIDPESHSYWRVEERAGIAYFYTSSDFIAWKRQRVATHGLTLSSVKLRFTARLNAPEEEGFGYGEGEYGGGFYGGVSGEEPHFAYLYAVNRSDSVTSTVPEVVVIPRPALWNWSIGSWMGTAERELVFAGSRTLRLHLRDPSEAQFTTWGESEEAALIEEAITDLWVMRDGHTLFRGRVVRTNDQLDASSHSVDVACTDYRGLLDRRNISADVTFTAQDQAYIVQSVLTTMQQQTGGYLGITFGEDEALALTGILRTVEFKAGQSVWSALSKLATMSGGFEISINEDRLITLDYPGLGEDAGEVLDFGGIVKAAGRTMNVDSYGNAIRQSGADGVPASEHFSGNLGDAPEGRWDLQFGDIDLTTSSMVEKSGAAKLEKSSKLLPTYQLTLNPGTWRGPDHIWLGDYVNVVVKSGRLTDVVKMRVFDISIEVDINDHENVSITVGDPKLTLATMLNRINQNLRTLQRR